MEYYLKVYFGFIEDPRTPEGWFSKEHLIYSSIMVFLAIFFAIYLSKKSKNKKYIYKVMKVTTILMLSFEIFKIIMISWKNHDPFNFLSMLPLFLCSIMLFIMPIATFSKGKLKDIAIDFSFIFGPLCMLTGAYLAGNYFSGSPVISFSPMVSVTTHCLSGFFGLYAFFTKQVSIKKDRIIYYSLILLKFEILAFIADKINTTPFFINQIEYENNYMFLLNDAGTPFSIICSLVNNNQTLYTIGVMLIYFVYLFLFVLIYLFIKRNKKNA